MCAKTTYTALLNKPLKALTRDKQIITHCMDVISRWARGPLLTARTSKPISKTKLLDRVSKVGKMGQEMSLWLLNAGLEKGAGSVTEKCFVQKGASFISLSSPVKRSQVVELRKVSPQGLAESKQIVQGYIVWWLGWCQRHMRFPTMSDMSHLVYVCRDIAHTFCCLES